MDGTHPWTTLAERELYRSPWRRFVVERVRTHGGVEIEYSYAEAPDAAFVVPLTHDNRLVLLRQYRHPVRDWVWEVPAGSIHDQDPAEVARRELREEVGGTAERLVPISTHYSCAGHLRQRIHIFLATGVRLGEPSVEPGELFETVALDPATVLRWAHDGVISDGESALALLLCEERIRRHLAGD